MTFLTVLRAELRSLRRDRLVWAAVLAFAAILAHATASSVLALRADRARGERAAHEDEARRTSLRDGLAARSGAAPIGAGDPRDPHAVGADLAPRAAVLPPGPLALVSVGQRDVLPQIVEVTTRGRAEPLPEDDGATPTRRVGGAFDPAFVLVFLLPLLVIALTYDLLTGERERGTLALVLSQPVSLTSFVLGKALSRASLVLGLALATGLSPAAVAGAGHGGGLARLGLYAALLLGYTLFWIALSLAVDAWARSSSASALVLVGAWLLSSFVVPGLSSVAVESLHPTPSRVALVEHAREAAREAEAGASALEGDHGKGPSKGDLGRRALEVGAQRDAQLAPVLAAFDARRDERDQLVGRLRFLSPAMVLSEALADVADSGVSRHRAFERRVEAFEDELRRFFGERLREGRLLTAEDYGAMPRFELAEAPASDLARRVTPAVAALFAAAAASLLLAIAGLRRPGARAPR